MAEDLLHLYRMMLNRSVRPWRRIRAQSWINPDNELISPVH
jgi:hypothetical protein